MKNASVILQASSAEGSCELLLPTSSTIESQKSCGKRIQSIAIHVVLCCVVLWGLFHAKNCVAWMWFIFTAKKHVCLPNPLLHHPCIIITRWLPFDGFSAAIFFSVQMSAAPRGKELFRGFRRRVLRNRGSNGFPTVASRVFSGKFQGPLQEWEPPYGKLRILFP